MKSLSQRVFSLLPRSSIDRVKNVYASLLESYYRRMINGLANGLNQTPRAQEVVVTLTSTPKRLRSKTDIAVTTLLRQSFRPDRVVLWLTDEIKADDLPPSFQHLQQAGLEVRFCKDVGPHTKLIHSLAAFPQSILVTADDDLFYAPHWLNTLYQSYLNAPANIHCHRAHLMRTDQNGMLLSYGEWGLTAPGIVGPSHLLFPTSGSGMLFPPSILPQEAQNIEAFRRLCPTNDDIWYKAMALLGNVLCQKAKPYHRENLTVRDSQGSALFQVNATNNDPQLHATFEAYNLLSKLDSA